MRTRTLLLLAVACGLVILVAGGVMLLGLTAQDDPPRALEIGEPAQVGDMDVTIDGVTERDGSVIVDVEIGGVDDPDGAAAFRLVVPSGALTADPEAGNHCGATTERVEPCSLAFRLDDDAGSTRVLLYQRGEERVRWELSAG